MRHPTPYWGGYPNKGALEFSYPLIEKIKRIGLGETAMEAVAE